MNRSTGVEITRHSVRLLELEGAPGKEICILRAGESPVRPAEGETPDQALARTLRETFVRNKVSADRTVLSIDAGECLIREVTLPFTDDDQIDKTVRFELENLIHNFTIEQLVVDYFVARKGEKESAVVVNAVPREMLRERLAVCEQAGLDPMSVDLDVWALCNALQQAGQIASDKTFVLLHGGVRFTKMVFFEGGRPRHIRSLRFGMPEITGEKVAAAATAEAAAGSAGEEAPAPEGGPEGDDELLVMSDESGEPAGPVDRAGYLTLLCREMSRFLLSCAGAGSPSHIVATGEVLRAPDILSVLEEKTGLPVSAADVLGDYRYDLTIDEEVHFQATYAVPLGLALKGIEMDYLGLDFRQEEFVYFKKFDLLKQSIVVLIALVAIALAFTGVRYRMQARDFRADAARAQQASVGVFKDTFPQAEVPPPEKVYRTFTAKYDQASDLNPQDHPLPNSALRLWKSLFDRFEEMRKSYEKPKPGQEKLFVMVDRLDIKQYFVNRITMDIRAGSVEQSEQLQNAIKGEPLFVQVMPGRVEPDKDGRMKLPLQISLEKPK